MSSRNTVEFDLLDPDFLRPSFRVIEAGAGSGKTYNLEFQVLRLVAEQGKRIDEIVLVTFTEAAAIEMRQRVRERIEGAVKKFKKLSEKPHPSAKDFAELANLRAILDAKGEGADAKPSPQREQRVNEAVARIARLRVTTIHGFCQSMLVEHGPNAGFPPLASTPVDGSDLAEEIAADWCRRYPGQTGLVDTTLAAKALLSDPDCDISLLFREKAFAAAVADPAVGKAPVRRGAEGERKFAEWQSKLNRLMAEKSKEDAAAFTNFVRKWKGLSAVVTFDDLVLRLRDSLRETGPDPGATEALRAFLCKELSVVGRDDDAIVDALSKVVETGDGKARRLEAALVKRLGDKFDGDVVDAVARTLLNRSDRAAALVAAIRAQFTCCLIDEFQDTDDSQWAIFGDLFRPRRLDPGSRHQLLVVVGDPKQAIYGFRGADIGAYNRAVLLTSDHGKVHVLRKNHRSSANFVRAFNQIFRREGYFGGSLTYEEAVEVKPEDKTKARPIEVVASNDVEAIPAEVARLLRDLDALDPPRVGSQEAPKERRTVGVLVRGNTDADAIHRALVEHRLPAALESTQSVFATQAAYLAQLLLQAVLESDDLRPRRALLYARPALFGDLTKTLEGPGAEAALQLFDAELADWLAGCRRTWTKYGFPSMWSRLTRVSPSEDRKKSDVRPDEKADLQLPKLQSVQQSLAAAEFRSRLLVDLAHVGELLGARQRENLWDPHQVMEHLRLKIAGSESDGDVEDADASLDEALRPENERPRVLVQTIHKSKGLQYDGVVLYLKPSKNGGRTSGMMLRSATEDCARLGIPVAKRLVLGDDKLYEKTGLGSLIERQKREEDARLLYVAITRAKHRLVVMTAPSSPCELGEPSSGGSKPSPESRHAHESTVLVSDHKGFHKVLARACIHPFDWRPCTIRYEERDEAEVADAAEWDPSLVGKPEPAEFTYEDSDVIKGPVLVADWPKHIKRIRGTTSFSVLTRDPHARAGDDKGPDEGGVDIRRTPPGPDTDLLLDGRIKGALFGTFVHELLDGLDFKAAAQGRYADGDLVNHVQARLRTSGLPALDGDTDYERLAAHVSKACQSWLKADLPSLDGADHPFALSDIDSSMTLSEVRFALRADIRTGTLERIQQLFAEEFGGDNYADGEGKEGPMRHVSLSGESVKGLLTGVADLIFEHGDRYYILDWKTNYLGDMVSHYDRKAVDAEVAESQYHLQYSLYAAALDAYLSQALGDGWSYDPPADGAGGRKSFGGVYYLFLRAFGTDKQGADKQDVLGCHHYRPTHKFISGLRDAITQSAPTQP